MAITHVCWRCWKAPLDQQILVSVSNPFGKHDPHLWGSPEAGETHGVGRTWSMSSWAWCATGHVAQMLNGVFLQPLCSSEHGQSNIFSSQDKQSCWCVAKSWCQTLWDLLWDTRVRSLMFVCKGRHASWNLS